MDIKNIKIRENGKFIKTLFIILVLNIQSGFGQNCTKTFVDTSDFKIEFRLTIPHFNYKTGRTRTEKVVNFLIDNSLIPEDYNSTAFLSITGKILQTWNISEITVHCIDKKPMDFEDKAISNIFTYEFPKNPGSTYFADFQIIISTEKIKKLGANPR